MTETFTIVNVIEQAPAALQAFLEHCFQNLFIELPQWTLDGGNRFYWLYLLSFVLLGAYVWRRYYRAGAEAAAPEGAQGLFSFLFPKAMYSHPSAMLDYKLLLTNRVLGPSGWLAKLVLGSASVALVATFVQQGLVDWLGAREPAPWTPLRLVGFTLAIALVADFSTYLVHALHHRYSLLWEFHKVHHSAEVLTPFTVYRKHPVYNLISRMLDLSIVGPFMGVVTYLFTNEPSSVKLFGANFVFSLFHVLGANLRHSHIWWSFGPWLSRVFISPAQHQIHHSKNPLHYNKNYGELFALWDWLFGTLYVPSRAPEKLEFGLTGEDAQIHPTLLAAYFVPFANCGRILRGHSRRVLASRQRVKPALPPG